MFNINDTVKIKSANIYGKITNIIKNKNDIFYFIILENNTKLKIKEEQIEKIAPPQIKTNNIKISYNFVNKNFNNELMIRHQNKLEALENVDRFISNAIACKEKRIKIIHGRHGEILKNAVHEYLKNCEFVDSFKLADQYDGSIGATIVNLK